MLKKILLLLLLCPSTLVFAEEVEIGGLLIDNTISRFGREFSYQFSQFWPDIPNTGGLNVQIKEQAVPRAGTKLSVIMNHQVIYVTYLGRRQAPIKPQVEQAIYILIDALAQSQHRQTNPDLAENGW
jgi:curli production assembly/transport component CsgE